MTKILFFVFFVFAEIGLYAQNSETSILHRDSIYSFIVEKWIEYDYKCGDSIQRSLRDYEFFNAEYKLFSNYYNDSTVKTIIGCDTNKRMGLYFEFDDKMNLEYLKFETLGVESGPEIYFYSNGLVKSIYNYGFQMSDLLLPEKTRIVKNLIDGVWTGYEETYYKKKTELSITTRKMAI